MAYDTSNFEQAEYTEVPFVPSASARARQPVLFGGVAVDETREVSESNPNYLLRAIAGGLIGAAFGAVCYAGFIDLTGWTIGYLAVLVGWLVGKGMMTASEDRGGPQYQVAAIALTYLAVAAGEAILVYLWASQRRPVPLNVPTLLGLAKVGLMFPMLNFMRSPGSGMIDMIILFVGLRAAYRMTSDNPRSRRTPFKG
ncbi:MAG TPA: hypothetical protein VFC39_11145 [Acidobacteriaceae bacterium]|nr:hypothetical protein [Acidobacteriaceae bacterium]